MTWDIIDEPIRRIEDIIHVDPAAIRVIHAVFAVPRSATIPENPSLLLVFFVVVLPLSLQEKHLDKHERRGFNRSSHRAGLSDTLHQFRFRCARECLAACVRRP